ncbi:hypothetical protein K3495_g6325 [Podosphaera aphanis]|nr:hypothetical protein K3495_g6325 [Podosphaera aphanis]
MSPPELSFATSSAFIAHLSEMDEKARHDLIAEFFNRGVEYRSQAQNYASELTSIRQQVIEIRAVNVQLKSDLDISQENSAKLLKSSAVVEYRLSESKSLIEDLQSQLASPSELGTSSGGVNKSELFRIDEKFTGDDKSFYPAFQRQIRIALSQNADRYTGLQSQISLIYQNLGPGPKSFLDRYLSDSEFQPFGVFLAEFQRLHNLSKIIDDKTLISCMRNGVTPELRTCVGRNQDIHKSYTFDEYVALCKDCVIRLELERPSNIKYFNQNPPRATYPTPSRGNNPTPPRFAPSSGGVASGANGVPLGGDPMDLDQCDMSHIGPDGHITAEERQRRFRLNLCMRCGNPGHRADNCRPKGKGKMIAQVEMDEEGEHAPGQSNLKD